jgi:hypothetical protein
MMGSSEQPPGYPGQPPGEAGVDWESGSLGTRVNEIVDAVEREASKLRQEAEHDAAQIRQQAQDEARRYVEHARHQSDAMVAERAERIRELSDALMARAEEVLARLEYAVPVKAGFENLVRALGETAERLGSQDSSEFREPSWEEVRGTGPAQTAPGPGQPPPGYPAQAPPPAYSGEAPAPGTATVPPPGGYPQPGEEPPASYQPPAQQPGYPPPAQQGAPGGAGWQGLDDAHRVAIQMAAAGSTRGEVEAHLAHAPAPTRVSVLDEIFGAGSPAETRVPWASPPG